MNKYEPTVVTRHVFLDNAGNAYLGHREAVVANIKADLDQALRVQLVRAFPDHAEERAFMARVLTDQLASRNNPLRAIVENLIAASAEENEAEAAFKAAGEEAERRSVSRTEVEYSYAWCAANPVLAGSKWSRDTGVEITEVAVTWREKERGIGDLRVWRSGADTACVIPHDASPSEADIALRAYLDQPDVEFDFSRDGFVKIVRTYAKS